MIRPGCWLSSSLRRVEPHLPEPMMKKGLQSSESLFKGILLFKRCFSRWYITYAEFTFSSLLILLNSNLRLNNWFPKVTLFHMQSNDTCGRKFDGCGFKKTMAASLAQVFEYLSWKRAILTAISIYVLLFSFLTCSRIHAFNTTGFGDMPVL